MDHNPYTLWLGNQASYDAYEQAKAAMNTWMLAQGPDALAKLKAYTEEEDDVPQGSHPLLQVQGNVGVVSIAGSTIEGSAGWMMRYGITGYDDIRNALVAAIQNPGVGSILMNVASGGGHVAGVHESAKLIARVDKIKPVITYTGSSMLSAALWQGSAGRKIVVSETAEVGSIGILMVHSESSKMYAEEGITRTVIRAGKFKALANPHEPLSDKGRELLEKNAQTYYDIFLPWVASNRGHNVAVADDKYGQGLTFVGKQAVEVGLADKVGNYEDAIGMAQTMAAARLKTPSQQKPVYGATNIETSPVFASAFLTLMGHNSPTR